MSESIKILLFDIDGVLINSESLHLETWRIVFERHGLNYPRKGEEYQIGRRGEDLAEWLTRRLRLDRHPVKFEQILEEKRQLFLEMVPTRLEPVAGVDAFLHRMKGRYRLGVVTSARLNGAAQVLARYGWRDLFEVFIGAEHVTRHKPDPQPYLQAMKRLAVPAEDCLVFEDSTVGVQAARASGASVCGVATSFSRRVLRRCGADWVARDFEDHRVLERALDGRSRDGWSKYFHWLQRR